MKVSEKNIIGIRKFMSNYILVNFTDDRKVTHDFLSDYLIANGIEVPKRVYYKYISESDILTGEVLFVCDEKNKVVAYKNPYKFNINHLLNELKETKVKVVRQKEEEIEDEYTLEHNNRIKVLSRRRSFR